MRTSVTEFTTWVRFKYLDSIIMFGRGRGRNTKMGAGEQKYGSRGAKIWGQGSRNMGAGEQKYEGRGAEI